MDSPRHALNNVLQTHPPPQGPDDPQRVQVVKGPSSNPTAQRALNSGVGQTNTGRFMTDAATLRGRVALVTGGSRGVGKDIAAALGGAGATVYVTGRRVAESEFGASCIPTPCDHTDGVRAHFVASRLAAGRMVEQRSGLIVNISFRSAQKHIANVPYGVSKAATDKMTRDMAHELREHGVPVVSLYPGLVRTEKVMEAAAYLDRSNSESPHFIGRAVAALTTDANISSHYRDQSSSRRTVWRGTGLLMSTGDDRKR